MGKPVSNLIRDDIRIEEDGTVTGTILYVPEYPEFSSSPEEQSGYFFPIYLNKDGTTLTTVKDGVTKTQALPDDHLLVIRLNGKTTTVKISIDEQEITTLNFEEAYLDVRDGLDALAVAGQNEDMDAVKPASTLISDNVRIVWDGINGKVKGNVHYYHFKDGEHFKDAPTGHYLPVLIRGYDGLEITVTGSKGTQAKLKDPKWIIRVDDFIPGKKATFEVGGNTIAVLDFDDLVLDLPTGENAIRADKVDYGGFGSNTVYYDGGSVDITWKGMTATVNGKLKWVPVGTADKLETAGNYFAFALVEEFNGKDITVKGLNEKTTDATDWVMLIKDKYTPIIVTVDETLIAKFDLSPVTLEAEG